MEKLKDLVTFNRYKSVESFNNANDISSSTISIVKINENIMDIYLGRTQLTHSNFPEVNIELRKLIDSLSNRLEEIKIEFDSNLSSVDEKYNKELSEFISNFESGLNDLIKHTNNLSKDISNIKSDIQNKSNILNQQIKDISESISDINNSISNQNIVIEELSDKISENNIKQISSTNDIVKLKQDIKSLKIEDNHIFEIISDLQNKLNNSNNNGITSDVENIKNDINSIFKENKSFKNDIINVKNNISNINISLSKRLNITESDIASIKNNVIELETALNDIDFTNTNISSIISDITDIKKKINDVSNELLNKIENNISEIIKLNSKDIEFINDISNLEKDVYALKVEDRHIFDIINELQSINKSILFDINLIKSDNYKINEEILLIKEKIKDLTGVDVDSFVSLEEAKRRLSALENTDKNFQKDIDNLKTTILENNNQINIEIVSIKERIEYLSGVDFESLKDVNQRLKELDDMDKKIQKNIEDLNETIQNGVNAKLQWLIL